MAIVPAIDQGPIAMHEYADAVLGETGTVAKGATMGPQDGKLFFFPSFENDAQK